MPYIYKSGLQFGTGNITINQTNPIREMTQAQYDALPASEKANGTIYFITDATVDKLIIDDPAPIGAILAYGGTTAPTGWLFCQGQQVSRTLYSELFAVIGTTYGSGDGSTTFNLPDLQGNVAVGANQNYGLGDSGGEASHLLIQNEIPKYDIGYLQVPVPNGHSQWSNNGVRASSVSNELGWSGKSNFVTNTGINSAADTSVIAYGWKLDTNGGSQSHNNMQPYIVTNYIIKAKDQGSPNSSILAMIDFFYPVGSYYETSDTTFDPNISWGGTWSLETEGLVHIGAGSTYTAGSTGGSKDAIVPYHRHYVAQQTGGDSTGAITVAAHSHYYQPSYVIAQTGVTYGYNGEALAGGAAQSGSSGTHNGMPRKTTETGGGHSHNIAAHYTDYNGTQGNTVNANMQPYVVVNRWHRTA